jgi:hypothetical protein
MISRAKSGSPNHREREAVEDHLASAPEQKGDRRAIVAGLRRYAGRQLQAHPDDGMEAQERFPTGPPSTIGKLGVLGVKSKGLMKGEE